MTTNELTTSASWASGGTSRTGKQGFKVVTGAYCNTQIVSFTKDVSVTDTIAYICTDVPFSSNIAVQANFSGNVATFATPYVLTENSTYYFLTDKGGASRTSKYANPFSSVRSMTNYAITTGIGNDEGEDATEIFAIKYVERDNSEVVSSGTTVAGSGSAATKVVRTSWASEDYHE